MQAEHEELLHSYQPYPNTNYINLYYKEEDVDKAARFKQRFRRSPTPSEAELEEDEWDEEEEDEEEEGEEEEKKVAAVEVDEVDYEEDEEDEADEDDRPPRRRRRITESSTSEEEEQAADPAAEAASGKAGGEAGGGAMELITRIPELAKEGMRVIIDGGWHAVVLAVTSTVVAVMYDDKKWEAIGYSQCRPA